MTRQALSSPPVLPLATTALFLDIDGTLVEFAETPEAVVVKPGLRERIDRLRGRLDGALALVSGRRIDGSDGIDRLFAPFIFDTAGQHGAEWRIGGERGTMPPPPAAFAEVCARFERLAKANPGVLCERKGSAVALHTRLAPQAAPQAETEAAEALKILGDGYRLQRGTAVLELVPMGADKGDSITRLMQQSPYAGRVPVFVGDDLTDEHGFSAVHRLGGFGVLVGTRQETAATFSLSAVPDVHAWLETLEQTN